MADTRAAGAFIRRSSAANQTNTLYEEFKEYLIDISIFVRCA